MDILLWIAVGVLLGAALVMVAAWFMWRRMTDDGRRLMGRINALPLRSKLRLAGDLLGDERLPWRVRIVPAAVVLYLAMPIDIVPDFIPVLGQIDDVILVVLGVGLLLRLTPRRIIDEHLEAQERSHARIVEGEARTIDARPQSESARGDPGAQ